MASGENTGTSAAQSGYDTDVLLELFHSALYLRKVLLGMKNTLSHKPTTAELQEDGSHFIPVALFNFFVCLVCGDDESSNISLTERSTVRSAELKRQVISIARMSSMQKQNVECGLNSISCCL